MAKYNLTMQALSDEKYYQCQIEFAGAKQDDKNGNALSVFFQ